MPSIPQIKVGNTTYDVKDKRVDGILIGCNGSSDLLDAINMGLTTVFRYQDETGTKTDGKAWRADKGVVEGPQYFYITYSVPASYASNLALINGHGWGKPYPLACFYDADMNLITSAGLGSNKQYLGLLVIIPEGTRTIVINGHNADDDLVNAGVSFFTANDITKLFSTLGPFGVSLEANFLEKYPRYKNVQNLPSNKIYNIAADGWSLITGLPADLDTYATLIKVNSASFDKTQPGAAYNMYLLANHKALWYGFETNYDLTWNKASGGSSPVTLAKKYLLIGDSYGDGYSHDGSNSGWCEYFAEEMGLSSDQYEAVHQGGSGFANGGFLARLNEATGNNFSDIFVLGGFNDHNATVQNIEGALATFCSRAKTLFPLAKIHIGCVGWIIAGTGDSAYSNWQEVRNKITDNVLPTYQKCGKYGAEYVNFCEYLLTDEMMTITDGYHPGEEGNRAIAHGIINAISTGCACLPFKTVLKG